MTKNQPLRTELSYFHLAPSGQRRAPAETRTIRDELNDLLEEYGYSTPAVTNIAQSYLRYLRPGERPRFSSWIIDDVVGPKATKLGEGFFVTQRMNVFVEDQLVATIRQVYLREFRILNREGRGLPLRTHSMRQVAPKKFVL